MKRLPRTIASVIILITLAVVTTNFVMSKDDSILGLPPQPKALHHESIEKWTTGLPRYPGAQQVQVTRSTIKRPDWSPNTPVQVTEITYLSSASPQEIATFYANNLPKDGWQQRESGWSVPLDGYKSYPFDTPGSWAGDSHSNGLFVIEGRPTWGAKGGEGLYFHAHSPIPNSTYDSVSYNLLATATLQPDGQVRITLHVEEIESSFRI